MKIKWKLRIYTVIIAILPIFLLGGIAIWQGSKILIKSETSRAEVSIKRGKEALNSVLDMSKHDLGVLANLEKNFKDNVSLVEGIFEEIASVNDYSAVYFGTTNGDMFLYPKIDRVSLPEDYDPRVRPWYKGAINTAESEFISAPYIDVSTGEVLITVSKKVIKNDNLIGVLGIDMSWKNFKNKFSNVKIGNQGYLYVLYKDGTALVHPDPEIKGTKKLKEFEFIKQILEQKSGKMNYYRNKDKKFVVFDNIEQAGLIIVGGTTYKDIKSNFNKLQNLIIIIIISIIIFSFFSIYIFGKDVNNGLNKILEIARNAANGNYSKQVEIERTDEIGETAIEFKKALEKQANFLKDIKKKGINLANISKETRDMSKESMNSIQNISENIEEVNSGIQTNSSSATEAASGIEEVARSSVSVAELSRNIGSEVDEASKKAKNGQNGIENVIAAMNNITTSIQKASESSEELSSQTEEIRNFVSIIQGISEQTNLLALNAAIEAARAGEAGKGFAVVADEIRKLAENSQKATEDIQRIIDELILKSNIVAKETEDGEKEAKNGNEIVKKVGEEFKLIIAVVENIHNMIDEIVNASGEQSASTEEMAAVMNDISSILEKSENEVNNVSKEIMNEVNFIEKTAKLSERLNVISDDMEKYLKKFTFSDEIVEKELKESKK